MEHLTQLEYNKILSSIGFELGVSPKVIESKLLCNEDKNDIKNRLITRDQLRDAVHVWMQNGQRDMVNLD